MSPKKKEEIAVPTGGGLPDYMKGDEELGRDQLDTSAIRLPFIMLLQGGSKLIKDGVEGAKVGHFANSVTSELFPYPVEFIPVLARKKMAKRFWARNNEDQNPDGNSGVECQSTDLRTGSRYGDCIKDCPYKPHPEAGDTREPAWNDWDGAKAVGWGAPKCSKCYEFAILIRREDGAWAGSPIVLSAIKSSAGVGEYIHSVFGTNEGALFSRVYELSSFEKTFGQDTARVMQVNVKRLAGEDEYAMAKHIFQGFKDVAWEAHNGAEYSEDEPFQEPEKSGDEPPENWNV